MELGATGMSLLVRCPRPNRLPKGEATVGDYFNNPTCLASIFAGNGPYPSFMTIF
jgi:hypothetical protein